MSNQNLSTRISLTPNIVVPGTSAGLVAAGGLTGGSPSSTTSNNGFNPQSGGNQIYVGYIQTGTWSGVSTTANSPNGGLAALTVQSGVWAFYVKINIGGGGSTSTSFTSYVLQISTGTSIVGADTSNYGNYLQNYHSFNPSAASILLNMGPYFYTAGSSGATLYLTTQFNGGSGTIVTSGAFQAIRIA